MLMSAESLFLLQTFYCMRLTTIAALRLPPYVYSSGTLWNAQVVHHYLVSIENRRSRNREEMSGCIKGWYLEIPPDFVGTA